MTRHDHDDFYYGRLCPWANKFTAREKAKSFSGPLPPSTGTCHHTTDGVARGNVCGQPAARNQQPPQRRLQGRGALHRGADGQVADGSSPHDAFSPRPGQQNSEPRQAQPAAASPHPRGCRLQAPDLPPRAVRARVVRCSSFRSRHINRRSATTSRHARREDSRRGRI